MPSWHTAFQAVPPAQQGGTNTATQPAPAPDPGSAPAPGGMSSMLMVLMFVPIILFMFWQSRSQQKKQETLISSLKKGDRIVTQSGLVGKLLEVDTRYAKVELAPGVKVQVLRSSLVGRDGEEPKGGTSEKPAAPKSEKPEPEKKIEK